MANRLALRQYIPLPAHPAGDFDHGDVYLPTGRVFIANTAAGTVEVVDGEHLATWRPLQAVRRPAACSVPRTMP